MGTTFQPQRGLHSLRTALKKTPPPANRRRISANKAGIAGVLDIVEYRYTHSSWALLPTWVATDQYLCLLVPTSQSLLCMSAYSPLIPLFFFVSHAAALFSHPVLAVIVSPSISRYATTAEVSRPTNNHRHGLLPPPITPLAFRGRWSDLTVHETRAMKKQATPIRDVLRV